MALFIPIWFPWSLPLVSAFDKTTALHDPQSAKLSEPEDDAILCHQCRSVVTTAKAVMTVAGQHAYQFTNPAEVTYEIVLYREAHCHRQGSASLEHTWFAGYAWQIALCGHCATHLGWWYSKAEGHGFYGLIRAQLQFGI